MKIKFLQFMRQAPIFVLIAALSCASYVREQSFKSENAKYDFAFLSDSTVFKDDIHQKLIEKYKSLANIDLLDINKIKKIKTGDYDVILIMDTCIMNSPSEYSEYTFINNDENKKNIILLISASSYSCGGYNAEIDAITSASRIENIDPVISEISKKIDRIISNN